MKKRIIIPTLLSAALFTACVKDNESDSVKNYRDAQTESVKVNTDLAKAKIETEKQEAAIKAAQAEANRQLAEIQKLTAEAKAKENTLAAADLEAKIEAAKLAAEKAKLEAEIALAKQRVELSNLTNDQKAEALAKYNNALSTLQSLNSNLVYAEFRLVELQNNVKTQEVANEQITKYTEDIAVYEAKKAALSNITKSLQQLEVEKAKKEADVAAKKVAQAEAYDKYNKASNAYAYNQFKTDVASAKTLNIFSGGFTRYFNTMGNYYSLGHFLSNSAYNYVSDIGTYLESEVKKITEGEFVYRYYSYKALEAKNVSILTREIAYRKDNSASYKTTLETATKDLAAAKKATAEAKKAYDAATGTDRDTKYAEYSLKVDEERTAQIEYDNAKTNYENNAKDIADFEALSAYISDLSPLNAVITKYNAHLESLKTTYFAYQKAVKAATTAQTELEAITATIEALTTGDVKAQIATLTEEIANAKKAIENLKANLANSEGLVTLQQNLIATLKTKIEAQTKLVEAYKAQL